MTREQFIAWAKQRNAEWAAYRRAWRAEFERWLAEGRP